jgi:hypothetical protein
MRTPASGPGPSELWASGAVIRSPAVTAVLHLAHAHDQHVAGLEDVLLHHQLGPLPVARLERARDLLVVVQRDLPLLVRVPDVRAVDEREVGDGADDALEPVAPGRFEDERVEGQVLLDEIVDVPLGDQPVESRAARPELGDQLVGGAGGRPARRVAFEEGPELVEVVELVGAVAADGGAAVRRRVDQPFRLEHDECLSHGRAADAEAPRELLLLQPLARGEGAVDNRVAKQFGGDVACVPNKRFGALHDCLAYSMQSAAGR